jgi:hypothetical protein
MLRDAKTKRKWHRESRALAEKNYIDKNLRMVKV